MENVLQHAESLAEAILESEEYIKMRLSEQAAMKDETAARLISDYTERRERVQTLLSASDMDHAALAEAGAALEETEKQIDGCGVLAEMQKNRDAFSDMMKKVNGIIRYVVTGETDEGEGCGGNCASCGGCH